MNSSPPKRATVSSPRTHSCRRRPTSASSWSPTSWPSESLITLKRSRSRNSSASRLFSRSECASATIRRSLIRARLGSPVRASW